MRKGLVFYDVDTQNDFMNKDGALYVPDAELIKPNLALLTQYARENKIPILGSVDRHFGTPEYAEREKELARNGGPFPDHCMDGTEGELKIVNTVVEIISDLNNQYTNRRDKGIYIPHGLYHGFSGEMPQKFREYYEKLLDVFNNNPERKKRGVEDFWAAACSGIDRGLIDEAVREVENVSQQKKKPRGIYLEKQHYDVFTNPNTEQVLKQAGVKEAVVYGVATDFCVKAAVLGMQARGIKCHLVTDAIKGVFPDKTKEALEEMARLPVKFTTTKFVLEGRVQYDS